MKKYIGHMFHKKHTLIHTHRWCYTQIFHDFHLQLLLKNLFAVQPLRQQQKSSREMKLLFFHFFVKGSKNTKVVVVFFSVNKKSFFSVLFVLLLLFFFATHSVQKKGDVCDVV